MKRRNGNRRLLKASGGQSAYCVPKYRNNVAARLFAITSIAGAWQHTARIAAHQALAHRDRVIIVP